MGIKGVKNEQFLASLAGHKWPSNVMIFGNVKEKGLNYRVALPDF